MAIVEVGHEAKLLLEISGVPSETLVLDLSIHERTSTPYHCSVSLACEDEIQFDDVVGKEALVTIRGDDEDRLLHGIVSEFQQAGGKGRFHIYRARIVPSLWLLSLEQDCRIFQNKTVQEIATQILQDGGITADRYDFRLQGQYPAREYCVQYRETDLQFVSRLLEEEGIYYFFEHSKEKHVVVFADSTSAYKPISGKADLPINLAGGMTPEEECVFGFAFSRRILSGKVTRQDFHFEKPSLDLTTQEQATSNQKLEVYDYPGKYVEQSRGKNLTKVRLQEILAFQDKAEGQSTCPRFTPGFTFTLTGHDVKAFNQEYILVDVLHTGSQPQSLQEEGGYGQGASYSNDFLCIPSSVTLKPERISPKPIVEGVQTAIVVGPSGEEIYCDEYGRVKVQFHWDREGKRNEKSSCWIRVSQTWAGAGWGAMHIPRIDQEVVVSFLEGDPDRPLITGRVYHGTNKPPYTLPDEKTKSTVKSNTTPGGGTANELLMEDLSGKTQVVLSNAYGHKITEDEESQTLTIETRDKNLMRFDDKNKNITVNTTKVHQVVMDDENKKILIKSTDGYSLELDDGNEKMFAKTKNGHLLVLDDKNKKVEIVTTDGHTAVLDDNNQKIGVTSKKGHFLVIDDSNDNITLEDGSGMHRIKLDIGGSKLLISTDTGSINVEAPTGKITLSGMDVEVAATNSLKMSGGLSGEFNGGTQTSVKGMQTSVEGAAMVEIKAALVKIN